MGIKKYFETNETELRLVDYVAIFYLILVIMYTADDFKKAYPFYLVVMGLIFHCIALLTWIDEKRDESYFGSRRKIVYKIVPIGLFLTYLASISIGVDIGEIKRSNIYNVLLFMITAVPMLMFYISMGYGEKYFGFLREKKTGLNYLFLGLIVIMLIGQKIVIR